MSNPLLDLDNKVLDIIKEKQPVTAADVAKLLPEFKVKDVNITIYQKLQPKGRVVQNGVEGSKPLWWTPDGLVQHQKQQQTSFKHHVVELVALDAADVKELERREWVKDQIKSGELRRRILDVLKTGGAQSVYEIRGQITDFSLEDIVTMIEELGSLKMVTTRDDGRLILAKKPDIKSDELRRRILDLLATVEQSWHSFRANGLVDLEILPILKELEEAKLLNRAPGGLFCTLCQTNCPVWSLVKEQKNKALYSSMRTEHIQHIREVEQKEIDDQIPDILRNHGAQSVESLADQVGHFDEDNVKMALEELKSHKIVRQREDKRWIVDTESPIPTGSLLNRITETLRNGGAMSAKELEEEFEDVDLEDIDTALKVLKLRKVIIQRDDKRWILTVRPIPSQVDKFLNRILDIFRQHGTLWSWELRDAVEEDVDWSDIFKAVQELVSRGNLVELEEYHWKIAAPPTETKTQDEKTSKTDLTGTIQSLLESRGPMGMTAKELRERTTADLDDILMTLEELNQRKVVTKLMGQRWRLTRPESTEPDDDNETETKDDGSFEIDRKTLQKGVSDAIDRMEVKQKHWAACMRTSNPTLASQIMDQLVSKPQDCIGLVPEDGDGTTFGKVIDICHELQGLGQIERVNGSNKWRIADKSAKVKQIRRDLHRLVDELCDLA